MALKNFLPIRNPVFIFTFLLAACQPTALSDWATLQYSLTPNLIASATMPPPTPIRTPQQTPTLPMPTRTANPTPSPAAINQPNADVVFVKMVQEANGSWTFHVTVSHPDTGWEDFADGWDVVLPDGSVLKVHTEDAFTRLLLHPHVDEQPFTRSQSGLYIPDGVTQVQVRAHDLVDGFGGQEISIDLSQESGPGYEIER